MNKLLALILLFISVLPISALSTVKHNKSYKLVQSWIINNDVGDNDISSFLLSTKYDQFQTISSAKKAIRRGLVFINNVKANNDNNKLLHHGDVVTYMIPVHDDQFSRKAIDYDEIPIVYEDDHFAIVVKPQGMSVFTTSSKDKGTNNDDDDVDNVDDDDDVNDGYKPKYKYSLSSNVIHQLNMKASDDSINMLRRAVPVHRLDRDTGGLVIVAKTTVALTKLSEMFSSRLIKKRYRAIVSGKLSNVGSMNTMLADIDGKQATTEYSSTAHITTSCGNTISIVDMYPLTGRKHQLRKHMKLAGCPILNDPKYSENTIPSATELKQEQMMLWALGLSFHHPITTEFINVTIPEPEMFSKVVEKLTTEVKPSFVYLLESSDKSSYVGATKDLTRRLRQHNREIKGGALLTGFKVYSGQKWTRVCHITDFPNWIEALRFEWSWKFHCREKKLLRDHHALNPQTDKEETKTEKIRNPDTNKLIKIGGPTWRKLVLEGKVDGVLPEMLIWRLSPLERRMLALKKLMSLEKSTKKALEYRHWPKSGPQIQWENQLAKQIYDQLT